MDTEGKHRYLEHGVHCFYTAVHKSHEFGWWKLNFDILCFAIEC